MIDPVSAAKDLARGFRERAPGHDVDGSFPIEDLAAVRAAGLLGVMVPEHLGGHGADFSTFVRMLREMARGSGATALSFNMHASVTGALAAIPDELARAIGVSEGFFDERDRVLRAAADGAFYQVAMSERSAGSRFSEMTTTYRREGDGWRIRGRKAFCTGAGHADAYLVVARSVDGSKVSQFLVPASSGLTVEQTWDSLGMRATASNDVTFDALVPHEALLGAEDLVRVIAELMPQWLVASYAAVYVGVAEEALDAAVDDVTARNLTYLPAVRARLGRADAAVATAWLAVEEAARRVDSDPGSPPTNRCIYRAKLLAGDTAFDVASSMVEACGTSSTRRGHRLERLIRDARCGALQPATSDVCADWLGAAAMGLDPHADAMVPRW